MSFSTYITTWDKNPYDEVTDMLSKGVIQKNTRIILAFASFNFDDVNVIPGLGNMSLNSVINVTKLVHANGAKISLSIGGATYPFYGSDLYSRPGDLASNINALLLACDFDGVDFDIEDTNASIINNAASLINTLRNLNPGLYITLTTPAQAWGSNSYQQALLNLTIGNLNAWQPMEYDLWVDPNGTYYSQIQYDLTYYINTWGVNPNKIILGLMPGKDDTGKNLTLSNALDLTNYTKSRNLQGVMIWDGNNDSKGIDGNAQYAFSLGIQSILDENNMNLFCKCAIN